VQKEYDVVFLGSLEGSRAELMGKLKERLAKKNIRFDKIGGLMGGKGDAMVGWDDYKAIIHKTRILLSSQTVSERVQIKGKVYEFLSAGAFCMVDRNYEYESVIPEDCVAYYDDFEDLAQKIEHYMAHPEECEAIAARGHAWHVQAHDSRDFWKRALHAMSVNSARAPAQAP